MTGPLNEFLHPAQVSTEHPELWPPKIRALAIGPSEHGGWDVALDIDDDREPGEDPGDVRLALVSADDRAAFHITLPVQVLRELARRIDEL